MSPPPPGFDDAPADAGLEDGPGQDIQVIGQAPGMYLLGCLHGAAEETVGRWYVALHRGDVRALDHLLAPEFVNHDPLGPGLPVSAGPNGAREDLSLLSTAFPDLDVTVADLFAEDDRVVARVLVRGTRLGPLPGIAPARRQRLHPARCNRAGLGGGAVAAAAVLGRQRLHPARCNRRDSGGWDRHRREGSATGDGITTGAASARGTSPVCSRMKPLRVNLSSVHLDVCRHRVDHRHASTVALTGPG